ncbi:MAG: tRNA (guanosine(46)-N7)-methyltransferase TrmB [Alphaproteobacteria bacterium]|nr:tRNA (guanosine(46)-N7)-methyltransferase TrmB [Alphaproteobacteria bacterium]
MPRKDGSGAKPVAAPPAAPPATPPVASSVGARPPPERLYGRRRGHPLRARQARLIELALPRFRLTRAQAADPLATFAPFVPRALWLEVGFGAGEHTLAQIAAHPDIALIGCEVFENGLAALLARLVPEGEEASAPPPPNLRLWPEDARTLLALLPEAALDRLFLLFPDPWPKARHAKRRFIHPANLALIARALAPGGELRVASDDPTYQDWMLAVLDPAAQPYFVPADPTAPRGVRARPEDWPPTRYEAKALREGRCPLYWRLRRR